jgi:uncharacterized protein
MDSKVKQPDIQSASEDLKSPVDASMDIIISDDEQAAYLGIRPPENGGQDLTDAAMIAELSKRHVTNGIKTDAVSLLAEKPVYNIMTLVAQGTLPVQGTEASLAFHLSLDREIKPKEREDGTVDYRNLGLIESVIVGQPLCTLTPAVKGIPGKTVTGKIILPEPVRNFGLPIGKNTKMSEDRLVLQAAINGCVEYQNGKVHVYNIFTVNGDVCLNTGNVDFDGSVVVNGDVEAGFTVKAAGNINIVGNVEGAVLEAGGDIRIIAGLVGQNRGRAICGGNFKALFVENAEIVAKGDVTADVFMLSQVRCGGSLVADGRKGAIIGGSFIVGKDVKALMVGTQSGIATTFELGVDPTINERIKYVNDRSKALNLEMVKLNQIIQLLNPLKTAGKLTQDKVEMLDKAILTQQNDAAELNDLKAEHESLMSRTKQSCSQFTCKRELYLGTKITISQVSYVVPSDVLRCKIYLTPEREITMVSM